jgi:hypothetical protein
VKIQKCFRDTIYIRSEMVGVLVALLREREREREIEREREKEREK